MKDFDEIFYDVYGIQQSFRRNYSTMNRDVPLKTRPHYTEEDFKHPQIVFGTDIGGLHWDYDDRLQQWNWEKSEKAWDKAKESGFAIFSANFYEVYLSEYFEKPVELICVQSGVNMSNGYPYAVFGYKDK